VFGDKNFEIFDAAWWDCFTPLDYRRVARSFVGSERGRAKEAKLFVNSRSPVVTFVTALAGALIALALVVSILPLAFKLAGKAFGVAGSILPLVLTICGLVSCAQSAKPRNIKILWITIIVLAPVLGPLLWFLWGKSNT